MNINGKIHIKIIKVIEIFIGKLTLDKLLYKIEIKYLENNVAITLEKQLLITFKHGSLISKYSILLS